jgi:beta-lactamase class A
LKSGSEADPRRWLLRSQWFRSVLIGIAVVFLVAPTAQATAWRPHTRAAREYATRRHGVVAFAVRTASAAYGWHERRTFPSASVLKAMLLVAYLDERSVRHRPLRSSERALLSPMIRRSDNAAASAIFTQVGTRRLRALARRAHMRRFTPAAPVWGNSRIDADDQARFLYRIDRLVPARHRRYAMYLLAHVVPSQRWGIGRVRPRGWRLYFKGGWGSGTGRVDHQVALLTRGGERVSVAILTYADGSHAYGKETLRGVAKRLLRGLAESQAASAER